MGTALEILIILLLVLLNGAFAMSELAIVSSRRSRLMAMQKRGVRGADTALALADDPKRFLPTVQVDSFSIASVSSGVSNFDASDLSFAGNELIIHASEVSFSEAGASFTLNFTTSNVPGPAGLAALAGLAAIPMRRRRG